MKECFCNLGIIENPVWTLTLEVFKLSVLKNEKTFVVNWGCGGEVTRTVVL